MTTGELQPTEQVAPATRWKDFRAGFIAIMPIWLGSIPFGAIYAVSALNAGLTPAQTLAMSLLVFGGAAQFTAVGLFAAGATPLTIIITTLIINMRHMLLAASIAPYIQRSAAWLKGVQAFFLTDESYAVALRRFLEGGGSPAYQLGVNISLYLTWQWSTVAGILLGSIIPDPAAYGLELIFPLTFIGLIVPLLRKRTNVLVAALSGALAIIGALTIPGSWYILIAGIVASGVGAWITRSPAMKREA